MNKEWRFKVLLKDTRLCSGGSRWFGVVAVRSAFVNDGYEVCFEFACAPPASGWPQLFCG